MDGVCLVPIGEFSEDLLSFVGGCVQRAFMVPVYEVALGVAMEPAFDHRRKQYNASTLLVSLLRAAPPEVSRVIGLTEGDLFLPIFTYLFGQAQLGGRGALVSTCRLGNTLYGMPEDQQTFRERVRKEVIHELGHTYGLRHCYHPSCVMRSSTYVEDIDQKSAEFCGECLREMKQEKAG